MVVLKNAENIDIASKFFEFILSKQAQNFLAKHGYLPAITVPTEAQTQQLNTNVEAIAKEG